MEKITQEQKRLKENNDGEKDWHRWGPYLSERQWGTVREDYSANGDAWNYFSHDHARSRAYRWGEDGIAGISDRYCNICFSLGMWNGKDPILKERLYGLTGPEGNHGEDVKELYYYLENTPTHSYMKHLYKYPQGEFPYVPIRDINSSRNREELEFELLDTGTMDNDAYFDVETEYAKADDEDILIKITATNRSKATSEIHLLPTLWIRNYWSFREMGNRPVIRNLQNKKTPNVTVSHKYVGDYTLYFEEPKKLLFTENETNMERIFNSPNDHPYKKDLFHHSVINGDFTLTDLKGEGTKFAPYYLLKLKGGESRSVKLRLTKSSFENPLDDNFDTIFKTRQIECAEFYTNIGKNKDADLSNIQRQAFAGLLWTKQYYNYDVETWLNGDPKGPPSPFERRIGRNCTWKTLRSHDILSMPDTWEYPWYAAWDSAFHCVSFALIDPEFAKHQLLLFTKEWYMAPNGQIPAYEWSFSDVNPPVQAWSAIEIFKIERQKGGYGDIKFLKRMFNKLALNFTWWVNRLDNRQNNVFEGGFLGLDNIGVFDRSHGIPGHGILEQVDGTSWMALYCLSMLEISLEIALVDDTYVDMATKYFGHFVFIAESLNKISNEDDGTWDDKEGFFYDKLILASGESIPIKIRSIAGLLSLNAVLHITKETLDKLPRFKKSVEWFRKYRIETLKFPVVEDFAEGEDLLLTLVPRERMKILMKTILNEGEFLSPYGIRSLSKVHENPYHINIEKVDYSISYEPGESTTPLFGGNSNWRGPIWMPLNYLYIQSLREFYNYCGPTMKFECPTGSNNHMDLNQIADDLGRRLISIFTKDDRGNRPVNALHSETYKKEHFKDHLLFYEYFHGDTGRGIGATHQTGWTALVANLIDEIDHGK